MKHDATKTAKGMITVTRGNRGTVIIMSNLHNRLHILHILRKARRNRGTVIVTPNLYRDPKPQSNLNCNPKPQSNLDLTCHSIVSKDISKNGTYVNGKRLQDAEIQVRLCMKSHSYTYTPDVQAGYL